MSEFNVEEFIKDSPYVGMDTETDGLDTHNGHAITVACCNMRGQDLFVDLRDPDESAVKLYAIQTILNSCRCIFHNAKFDIKMLQNSGYTVAEFEDTILMADLINEYEASLKLEFLAKKYLGAEKYLNDDLTNWIKLNRKQYHETGLLTCPRKIVEPYNCNDATITIQLFYALRGRLRALDLEKQYETEKQFLKVLVNLERVGAKIDVAYGLEKYAAITTELAPLEKKIQNTYHIVNIRSPKQVKEALARAGIQVTSTDKEHMADLAASGNPIADDLLMYRKKQKLCSTYLEPILSKCDSRTHRLHATFNQTNTLTGRLSSSDPNLQNIPKAGEAKYELDIIRKMFITEPDYYLLGADYDQEEMRIIADETNCTGLLELFRSGSRDVYIEIAKVIWPGKEIDKRLRYIAKQNVLGTSYGMGPAKFCIQSKRYGIHIEIDEAVYVIGVINERFPEIKETLYRYGSQVRRQGFVRDRFGKRYNVPVDFSYKALNAIIQGSAAQVLKRAFIELDKISDKTFRPINTIHDEFLFEVHKSIAVPDAKLRIKTAMESVSQFFKIPLTASIKEYEGNWGTPRKAA